MKLKNSPGLFAAVATCTLTLVVACGGGGSGTTPSAPGGTGGGGPACRAPLPATVQNVAVTDHVPTDYDAAGTTPAPTGTTTINFSIMLPARCPGDTFPLILQSHGYGGTRLKDTSKAGHDPAIKHFSAINFLVEEFPAHGYVVISYDERGHGTPAGSTAPHNARAIDPAAETQDARVILNWAYCHSGSTDSCAGDTSEIDADPMSVSTDSPVLSYVQSYVQREDTTGIPKDVRAGTIGYSYGGGFEMPLALLDARIDTMVPNGTWNNLLYSLLPGDGVKLGFDSLLCLLAEPDPSNKVGGNVNNTPLLATLCSLIGPNASHPETLRTRVDLASAATSYAGATRAARDSDELLDLFYTHGPEYFASQTRDGKSPAANLGATPPYDDKPGYMSPALLSLVGGTRTDYRPAPSIPPAPRKTPVSALFIQGNRDTLFNLVDSYFNYSYFKSLGGDVRLLTTEGGHMNPLAFQTQGSANCGGVDSLAAIMGWFNHQLKGAGAADPYALTHTQYATAFEKIPQVCISVADTPPPSNTTGSDNTSSDPAIPGNSLLSAVLLDAIPVGSLSGAGAVPATTATLTASVPSNPATDTAGSTTATDARNETATFVPVKTIATAGGAVLAGIPTAARISVTSATSATTTPVAYVGVGIMRGSSLILVDDEVTPFAALAPDAGTSDCPTAPATDHCHNRGTNDSIIMLPGIGERLQDGDVVGLLFYQNEVQYCPASTGGKGCVTNAYTATVTGVQLPILIPGTYAGSRLSTPASP